MEVMNAGELKKAKAKNLHFYIYEEIPSGSKGEQHLMPIYDQEDLANFDEQDSLFVFQNVQLVSSLMDNDPTRSILDRTLQIEVHETYFES